MTIFQEEFRSPFSDWTDLHQDAGCSSQWEVSVVKYSMPLNKVEKLEKHLLVFIANNEKIRV